MLHNDGLDDPMGLDRQASFGAGMASDVRANLLPETAAQRLVNVVLDSELVVENRRGWRKLGTLSSLVGSDTCQGLWWFDTPSYQFLLALAGGKLYRCNSAGTWTLVDASAAPSTTAMGHGTQVGDYFYLTTGGARGKYWSGSGLNSSSAGTSVTDGPSTLGALTSMRFRMFGLDASSTDTIYCSNYLPTSGTPWTVGVTAIEPFRAGDGTGDPVVSLIPWRGLFSLVVLKRGSIWTVDTSQATSAANFAVQTSFFGVQQVGWLGLAAARTAVRSSNDILFLSHDGVRSVAKTIEDGEGEVSEALTKPIDDLIRRINRAYVSTACAAFHAGKYLCAVPLDSATTPDTVLVYHVRAGAWSYWTGIKPVAFVRTSWTGQPQKLVALDSRGHVLEYRDHPATPVASDYRDNVTGSDVRPAYAIRTRAMTWGQPSNPKAPDHAEFEFDRSEAFVDIDVYADNDTTGVRLATHERTGYPGWVLAPDGGLAADYPGSTLPCLLGEVKVKRIIKSMTHFAPAREFAFEIREASTLSTSEASETGMIRMRSVQSGAFLETLEEQA